MRQTQGGFPEQVEKALLTEGGLAEEVIRRVLVSAGYTGSDSAVERLRERHGQPVLSPIAGEPTVSSEYIRWHRDPELGAVFREPALKL